MIALSRDQIDELQIGECSEELIPTLRKSVESCRITTDAPVMEPSGATISAILPWITPPHFFPVHGGQRFVSFSGVMPRTVRRLLLRSTVCCARHQEQRSEQRYDGGTEVSEHASAYRGHTDRTLSRSS